MSDITTLMMAASGGAVTPTGYQISRSLRFNSADSAYLSKAFAANSDATKATFSFWHKRSVLATEQQFYQSRDSTGNNNNRFFVSFVTDIIRIRGYDSSANLDLSLDTTAVYRDVSSWYHILVVLDTTQATSSDRVKLYINGELVTSFSASTYPSLNQTFRVANSVNNAIGHTPGGSAYLNGYLAEYHFLDGVAASVTDFGEVNATTGVWTPIAYAGTYGTNGFYLDFSDNTSTTTLGYDAAGSNDWTLNNFSVTAGAGNDSLVDTPTPYGTDTGAGGEVRGNYCTLNPLNVTTTNTYTNGNLDVSVAQLTSTRGTMAVASGKWYWEIVPTNAAGYSQIGICTSDNASTLPQSTSTGWFYYSPSGVKQNNNVQTSYGNTYSQNDVIGVALDIDAGKVWWSKNGVWQASGDPASGTNAAYTNVSGAITPAMSTGGAGGTHTFTANFGQRPFAYTAPSGFKALCTTNLPDPTVVQGDDYFNTVLYTGDNTSNRAITGYDFAPDLIWLKSRSNALNHRLVDAVQGVTSTLASNLTTAAVDASSEFISLDSSGFTVTQGASFSFNASAYTYAAWGWNAGGSNATNTDGTITSTVRANTTAGFSIVSYTGTGSAATVGHGLGVAPSMIIVKNRDQADAWQVYHAANTANPETDYLVLNTTAATADAADRWNDTAPTSTVFSIGNGVEVNTNTEKYVAYCFAEVPGFSAFGKYTGNGSSDGPFIYTGFRPAFLMIKRTDTTNDWEIQDTTRSPFNVSKTVLVANSSNAESSYTTNYEIDVLSSGFKLRSTGSVHNASGGTYIYAAFAENPFKYSLAR